VPKTAEGLLVAPDRADAISSMMVEFGDSRVSVLLTGHSYPRLK